MGGKESCDAEAKILVNHLFAENFKKFDVITAIVEVSSKET